MKPVKRPPPSPAEAVRILSAKRTRGSYPGPPSAARRLDGLMKRFAERFPVGGEALAPRWPEIVGEETARITEPVKLTRARGGGGVLEVRVAGAAAVIVQHRVPEIIARVNLFLGPGSVDRLRLVQGPLTRRAAAPRVRRKSPPLDAAAEAQLSGLLSDWPEDRLRAAMAQLGRGVLAPRRAKS
jgi:hypothetical protein